MTVSTIKVANGDTMSAIGLMQMTVRKSLPMRNGKRRSLMTEEGCWHPNFYRNGRLSYYRYVEWPEPDSDGKAGDRGE